MNKAKNYSEQENEFDEVGFSEEVEYISKSELKRQSEALHQLGKQLVDLPASQLNNFNLDDELKDALLLAQRINKKKDGYRRQLQFIGKLMRQRDVTQIEEELAKITNQHQAANAQFHAVEQAREDVINKGDDAIQHLLEAHPEMDRQKLRNLQRQVKKEREKNQPPKAFRELFQYLKEFML